MPPHLDNAPPTMLIGQVAKLMALTVDAVRFYERLALLPIAPRTAGRFRLYTNEDVARLYFIRRMQGLGFSLHEIRQLSELREHHRDACHEIRDLLKTKLREVRLKIRELEQLEGELTLDLRKCNRERGDRKNQVRKSCPILSSPNGRKNGALC